MRKSHKQWVGMGVHIFQHNSAGNEGWLVWVRPYVPLISASVNACSQLTRTLFGSDDPSHDTDVACTMPSNRSVRYQ